MIWTLLVALSCAMAAQAHAVGVVRNDAAQALESWNLRNTEATFLKVVGWGALAGGCATLVYSLVEERNHSQAQLTQEWIPNGSVALAAGGGLCVAGYREDPGPAPRRAAFVSYREGSFALGVPALATRGRGLEGSLLRVEF